MDSSTRDRIDEIRLLQKKLHNSRMRILVNNPFFGTVLMSLGFKASEDKNLKVSTDGTSIFVSPSFVNGLSDEEVDIVILHELMHIVLKHPFRYSKSMDNELFHLASDIVVNSTIMHSREDSTTPLIVDSRVLPYRAPDGTEGHLHTVEEVYEMLLSKRKSNPGKEETRKKKKQKRPDNVRQSDTKESVNLPEKGNPLLKIVTDYPDSMYLYQESYDEYGGGNLYKKKGKAPSFNTYEIMVDKLGTISPDAYDVEVEYLDAYNAAYDTIAVPFIGKDGTSNIKSDGLPKELSLKKTTHAFYDFAFDSDSLSKLKETPLKNTSLAKKEEKYREYAYGKYLSLPSLYERYFKEFVKKTRLDKTSDEIVYNVRNLIATWAKYNARYERPKSNVDPILYFMEKSKEGICLHFAVAAMMTYRTLGIPSRIACGFVARCDNTETIVSEGDSHAWVEVYVDRLGWVMVDPTPVSASFDPSASGGAADDEKQPDEDESGFDSHDKWPGHNDESVQRSDEIDSKMMDGQNIQKSLKRGIIPGSIQIMLDSFSNPTLDWRCLLQDFIQEDITDYSFFPPDRRFQDSMFMLPDFNEPEESVSDILFMVDDSGSMSDEMIRECVSEILGAIEQFQGRLKATLTFFDATIRETYSIDENLDMSKIAASGRGGTNFNCVFDKADAMADDGKTLKEIIVLTDGEAPFPEEKRAKGIPILWIINNDRVTPPYGKIARIGKGSK